jgi:hypothetical protein
MSAPYFIVTATVPTYDGLVAFYYTGKAGEGYESSRLCEAFTYNTVQSAQVRADNLNRGSSITKRHWTVQEWR